MKCKFCRYDNTPLPGNSPPDNCESCGRDLETTLSGAPDISMENFL